MSKVTTASETSIDPARRKKQLLTLNHNLNILLERESKYGGNPALELVNQIADHRQAIELIEQALGGRLTDDELEASLQPLLLAFHQGQVLNITAETFVAGDLIQNITHILSAAEEMAKAQEIATQQLSRGVRDYLHRLQIIIAAGAEPDTGSPYKGLLAYRLNDAGHFFGRDQAIADLLLQLKRGPLIILHAESGGGKTSLLQAGVAPRLLAASHLPLYLRPYNVNPALVIKRAFIPDLREGADLAVMPLHQFLRQVSAGLGAGTTLYILLDQFEEFFTHLTDGEKGNFIGELAECLDDVSLDVRWVLALRSEYFGNLANFRPRIRNPFENDYRLNRLTRTEAQTAIIEPARRRGLSFETGLVETLLDDLGQAEVAPPQIQLVCLALYEELKPGETMITRADYEREGGAAGILRGHLERVLSRDLPVTQRSTARRLLETLITSEQRRIVRSHTELATELSAGSISSENLATTLNQLVDSRLLKVEETENGLVYELAHDYLLDEIKLDPELQARKAIQELLEQEVRAFKRFKTLLTAERLAIIEPYRAELSLTAEAEELLNESRSAAERQRAEAEAQQQRELRALRKLAQAQEANPKHTPTSKRISNLLVMMLATFLFGIGLVFGGGLVGSISMGLLQSGIIPCMIAIVLFVLLIGVVIVGFRNSRGGQVQARYDAEFSPDGTLLVTVIPGCARLWDASGNHLTRFNTIRVVSAAFSPDSKYILLAESNQQATIWDIQGTLRTTLKLADASRWKNSPVQISGVFSPDGQTILTTLRPGYTQVWEASGKLRTALKDSTDGIFSPDGKYILTIAVSDNARLWNTQGNILAVLEGHTGAVRAIAFSPDGALLATASADRTARVWNLDGELVAELKGHTGAVTSVCFSPDGTRLLTASEDRTARIWECTGAPQAVLEEHNKAVVSAIYSPDGLHILTAGKDGTAKIWSATGRFMTEMKHPYPQELRSTRFSPDGQRIVTVGERRAEIWDIAGQPIASLDIVPEPTAGAGGAGAG